MDPLATFIHAVKAGHADEARQLLDQHPKVRSKVSDPHPDLAFDSTPLLAAVSQKNRSLIEVLLAAGADIDRRSGWWAGGFGVLDAAAPDLAPFLIERGATVDVNAASRLGMVETLAALLDEQPERVHARGGDGQTPLHVAANVEVAALLVDRGADVNALDVDHESTPAQYMVRDRQDVVRYLMSRGARTDVLLTSALGDLPRTREHLDRDPSSVQTSVSERFFPKKNPRSGGTIYNWTLGGYKTAHAVAREFGHDEVYRLLMERSPAATRLVAACALGDETEVRAMLDRTPDLAAELSQDERARLPAAAESNDPVAVRLMLMAGWPWDVRGGQGGTALHWAAWHGNAPMVREILRYHRDVEVRDTVHGGTPLGWALHGSMNSWHRRTGNYGETVVALRAAGAQPPDDTRELECSDDARAALRGAAGDSA
jgi:ankyrin repeat protein